MCEFKLVDRGSSLFEKASGCILHRNPYSGKVMFLSLGRWRETLQPIDLPVNHIVLSDHLDLISINLRATPTSTKNAYEDLFKKY